MCGATNTKRRSDQISTTNENSSKQSKVHDTKDIFEAALSFADAHTLVRLSRVSPSLKYISHNVAKSMVLEFVDYFVRNGDVEFTEGIAYKRAEVETWCGLLHSLQYEPHEVTLSAYVAERFDTCIKTEDVIKTKQEISDISGMISICKLYGFSHVHRGEILSVGERTICPYDGLPAHVFTYSARSVSIVQTSKFTGALRCAFTKNVKSRRLSRCRVDGWGSWRLTPLLRYENYYDFDADIPFRFHLNVPPYSCLSSKWVLGSPLLSQLPRRRSLVLDLDETLIHTEIEPIPDADFTFTLSSNEGCQKMYVRTRPHAKHFLAEVSKHFEIIVFTASERPYAEHVLLNLDPTGCLVEHVLCREDCTYIEGEFIKDLGSLRRDLSDVVLIDNRPEMYCYHPDNGIPISSWFEDRRDCELLRLMPSLARLTAHTLTDVRGYVRHHWRTFEHVKRVSKQTQVEYATQFDSNGSSPLDLESTDWLGTEPSEYVDTMYYNEGEQKNNSLFSLNSSNNINTHLFFKDTE